MKRRLWASLAAGVLSGILVTDSPGLAAAETSGDQRFDGVIIASGKSGVREVVSSVIVGRGVLRGVGRIVEIESLPNDPENVNRDDLVFPDGTLHISVVNGNFELSVDPRACTFIASIEQTGTVEGGTGRYAGATGNFTGSVTARGVGPRTSDGICSQEEVPLIEVDTIAANGTLTF